MESYDSLIQAGWGFFECQSLIDRQVHSGQWTPHTTLFCPVCDQTSRVTPEWDSPERPCPVCDVPLPTGRYERTEWKES